MKKNLLMCAADGLVRSIGLALILEYYASMFALRDPRSISLVYLLVLGIYVVLSILVWRRIRSRFLLSFMVSLISYLVCLCLALVWLVSFPEIHLFVRRELVDADGLSLLFIILSFTVITEIVQLIQIVFSVLRSRNK